MKKKRNYRIVLAFTIGLLTLQLSGCKKKEDGVPKNVELPTLYTLNVTVATDTSFVCGGMIQDDGGAEVKERGICWGYTDNPTIDANNKVVMGSGSGRFCSPLLGITSSTLYYIRAYAINSKGICYGNSVKYVTPKLSPRVYTLSPNILSTSAVYLGWNVLYDGGEPLVSQGIFWTTNPAIDPAQGTRETWTNGPFKFFKKFLSLNTTYYYRAYALNGSRWGYGDIKSFTLTQMPAGDTTQIPISISSTTVVLQGLVNPNGLETQVYFEYGLTTDYGHTVSSVPTTISPPFLDRFSYYWSVTVSGLSPYTQYHCRIKSLNAMGTVYGQDVPFYTQVEPGTIMQGGIAFYSDYKGHGLVCAPMDQEPSVPWWKNDGSPIQTLQLYKFDTYLGKSYTDTIVKVQGNGFYAAKLCHDLTLNGYSDWYLPNSGELAYMQQYLAGRGIGNFTPNRYWSSTESDVPTNTALTINFSNGTWSSENKSNNRAVRAIRAF